jgi:hypothetical protein
MFSSYTVTKINLNLQMYRRSFTTLIFEDIILHGVNVALTSEVFLVTKLTSLTPGRAQNSKSAISVP